MSEIYSSRNYLSYRFKFKVHRGVFYSIARLIIKKTGTGRRQFTKRTRHSNIDSAVEELAEKGKSWVEKRNENQTNARNQMDSALNDAF